MKFLLLIISSFLSVSVFGQSNDSLALYFVSKGLLKEEQYKAYKNAQKLIRSQFSNLTNKTKRDQKRMQQDMDVVTNLFTVKQEDDTLTALTKFLLPTSNQPIMVVPGWYIQFRDTSSQRPPSADSLQAFGVALFNSGLISKSEWTTLKGFIKKKDADDSLTIAMRAFIEKEKTTEFRTKEFAEWIKQLSSVEFFTKSVGDSLIDLASKGELRSVYQVLEGSSNAVVIDLNQYPANPSAYIKDIHEKVAFLSPALRFDSFRYRIEVNKKESFKDYTSYQAVVDVWQKDKKYSMASFYSPQTDTAGMMKDFGKIGNDFYQIFNKILREQHSPFRLYSATVSETNNANYNDFAILALTPEQAKVVSAGHMLALSRENVTGSPPLSGIRDAINIYHQIGLFSHLSLSEVDSAAAKAEEIEINNYSDILSLFPKTVFEIDLEYGVNKGQYKEITKDIASISRNHFNPTNIIDGYDYAKRKLPFAYGFILNGKVYRTKLKQDDDWLDTGFWELIERAVTEQDKVGRFYDIYPNDGMRVIYLTHEQYQVLKEKGLLEFERIENE